MTQAYSDAFFELHRDLPGEGTGSPADVARAAEVANVKPDAWFCDAACGAGADIAPLLNAAPEGLVTALEKVAGFVRQAQGSRAQDPRTTIFCGDMTALTGRFDFIWCAAKHEFGYLFGVVQLQ